MVGSGKMSPRQKMINLMYIVFIAIMAMTVSKEVLSAFGLMEERFQESNSMTSEMNAKLLVNLEAKANEKPKEFGVVSDKAKLISMVSDGFYKFLATNKQEILDEGGYEVDPKTGSLPFESMKKSDYLDEKWFTGDRLTKKGDEVIAEIQAYKTRVKEIIGDDLKYDIALRNFDKKFDISDVTDSDGVTKSWLDYHFKGFPSIASYTKLTAMQNDVRVTEANMFNLFLGNTLDEAVSLKNYQAIVLADKSAFFAGEKFQGKVVIGKYADVRPTKLVVNGKVIDLSKAIDETGAARLDFNVGNVGEQEIKGQFTFLEDGVELPIDIVGNYVVVPRPNSATISADKMNVVYRGVANPMTISFAGVSDNKVQASAPGLSSAGGGKYIMNPQSGREVTIKVSATLDDGSSTTDSKTFRIKNIPKPTGNINGQTSAKLPRNNVEIARVSAVLEDFDFELPIQVTEFMFKVEGQPSIQVSGSSLNAAAKSALRAAKRGSTVQFFDIKAQITNNSVYKLPSVTPVSIELSN
jgi:gliding motility-associated protein GldM